MTFLRDLYFWLSHGFPLHRAWDLSRHPRAKPTPRWRIYSTVVGLPVSVFFIIVFVIRAVRATHP